MSDSAYMFGQWAADDDGEAAASAQAEYEQQARAEDEDWTPEVATQDEADLLSVAVREFAEKHGIPLPEDD